MAEIDLPSIERLMALMQENEITEFQYQSGEVRIELRRGWPGGCVPTAPATAVAAPATPALPAAGGAPLRAADDDDGLLKITSPMVGTYYAAPDPESSAFVNVGTTIDKNTTVCLIEAMKVFNEIKAEIDGTVERVAVRSGDAVEYGQVLFYVRP